MHTCSVIKLIVCVTSLTEEEKDKAASIGAKSCSWRDFLQLGKENQSEPLPPKPSDICTIMYTSGSSGNPKGVILTHENISTYITGVDIFMEQFEGKMTVDDVYISLLPLAHILDCMIEEYFFHKGSSVGYYHGDINELRDDLMELKPTFLARVPRVLERIHEGVPKALEELNPVSKLNWMMQGYKHKDASPLADLLAFRKVKAWLGGRIRPIVSGGAPLSSEVEEFLRVSSCAFVLQGYGLTETCGLATLGFPDEMCLIGTVGSTFVYNEVRLEEVPEMGYDPYGDPPRSEICLRGKTALLYLEKVYCITPIIEDIWVYGDSYKSTLVAVIVPNEENTKRWAQQNGYQGSFSELCSLNQLREHAVLELRSTAERIKLRGFEYIKEVILETKPF